MMRSVILVQDGLKDSVQNIMPFDSVDCVESRKGPTLPPGQRPLVVVRRKRLRDRAPLLPDHLADIPQLCLDPEDPNALCCDLREILLARIRAAVGRNPARRDPDR